MKLYCDTDNPLLEKLQDLVRIRGELEKIDRDYLIEDSEILRRMEWLEAERGVRLSTDTFVAWIRLQFALKLAEIAQEHDDDADRERRARLLREVQHELDMFEKAGGLVDCSEGERAHALKHFAHTDLD